MVWREHERAEAQEGQVMVPDYKEWEFEALTDIWTGDAKGRGDHLVPTGLMGSLRWWFEVLVRGLGGKACDPTGSSRCSSSERCVVCELFGCTGWARKFRLMVIDEQGQVIKDQIKKGQRFKLRFIPLRSIREEEWCLLDLTLRLIADYGAIGGKTVLKPSDEPGRENEFHHRDFGLIQLQSNPEDVCRSMTRKTLEEYVSDARWRRDFDDAAFSWASLKNFWCVKGRYLARQSLSRSTFNQVLGRKQPKNNAQSLEKDDRINRWLAGRQQESKKIFSFKEPAGSRRTFGFIKPDLIRFEQMLMRLKNASVWKDMKDHEFLEGPKVLDELVAKLTGG